MRRLFIIYYFFITFPGLGLAHAYNKAFEYETKFSDEIYRSDGKYFLSEVSGLGSGGDLRDITGKKLLDNVDNDEFSGFLTSDFNFFIRRNFDHLFLYDKNLNLVANHAVDRFSPLPWLAASGGYTAANLKSGDIDHCFLLDNITGQIVGSSDNKQSHYCAGIASDGSWFLSVGSADSVVNPHNPTFYMWSPKGKLLRTFKGSEEPRNLQSFLIWGKEIFDKNGNKTGEYPSAPKYTYEKNTYTYEKIPVNVFKNSKDHSFDVYSIDGKKLSQIPFPCKGEWLEYDWFNNYYLSKDRLVTSCNDPYFNTVDSTVKVSVYRFDGGLDWAVADSVVSYDTESWGGAVLDADFIPILTSGLKGTRIFHLNGMYIGIFNGSFVKMAKNALAFAPNGTEYFLVDGQGQEIYRFKTNYLLVGLGDNADWFSLNYYLDSDHSFNAVWVK